MRGCALLLQRLHYSTVRVHRQAITRCLSKRFCLLSISGNGIIRAELQRATVRMTAIHLSD